MPATCSLPLDRDAVRRAARELKAAGVESIAVCYLFSFMNPAHEEETRATHPGGIPGRARLAVERGAAAHPRMAAALHHAAQRLSRAGDGALHRPSQPRPRLRRRRHPAALPDAVERRRDAVLGRDRGRTHGAHAVLRPRRRRAGERLSRRGRRARRSRHPRHGRHLRRHRLHRGRRAARNHRRHDRAPADRRAGARHDHRSRRAAARSPGSTAAASSMSGRRAPAPIPARPATDAAARGRPSPTPTWSAAISIRIISSAARRSSTSPPRAPRSRPTSPIRSRWTCWPPPPASSASSTCAWPTRCACSRPSAASIFPPSRCCRSAAPARCTPPRSPRSSACGASWCRRGRARSRRWACSAPTWCTTTSAPSCARSPRSTPDHAEDIFRQLEGKAREELEAEGMDAAAARFVRELDLRYTGQGYELRTPLDGLFTEQPDRGIARRRARTLRRAPRADPRPRRQGAPGRGGELSRARARHRAEISSRARSRPPASPRAERLRGQGQAPDPFRRARHSRRGDGSTSATGSTSAQSIAGPAIVEQFDATTVIPPGWTAARWTGYRNSDSCEKERDHGRHHHPGPAQQDREPGR